MFVLDREVTGKLLLRACNVYDLFLSVLQVSIGVPSKPSIFTFVPVVRKLPFESIITEEERSGALTGEPNKVQKRQHTPRRLKILSPATCFSYKAFIKMLVLT